MLILVITFDIKIVLIQGLQHGKVDFKSFPTIYHMSNSDNKLRNDSCLKFAKQQKSDECLKATTRRFVLEVNFFEGKEYMTRCPSGVTTRRLLLKVTC